MDKEKIEPQIKLLFNTISCSNIKLDEVLDNIESMNNKKILEQHPYAITENKDGRFSTYLSDSTKVNKRRKIVKASRELLEKEIIKLYKEREKEKSLENICLSQIYPEWIDFKALHTESTAYIKTIDELWNKYYLNDSIINIPLVKLDKYTLDVWAHNLIRKNNMTKKKYYNTTIIMRQALEYAVERNIILNNPFSYIKVDSKLFRKPKKKKDDTQVFLTDEQEQIEQEAYKDFNKTGSTACLGIPFAFQTGMRISEIVGLKWSDINEEQNNSIHVQRMESVNYSRLENGKWGNRQRIIIDRTKSDVGNRNVFLTSVAMDILKVIWETNEKKGYDNSGYIFLDDKGRIKASALDSRIRKYCNHIDISEKGMHKIRKTYISTLIDNENININYIRQQVGHADERTTYGNYCFNRKSQDLTENEMEKSLVIHSN